MEVFHEAQPDGATHEAHGVRFVRTGSCNQCGACGCLTKDCPHAMSLNGKVFCAIYDQRDQFCEECGHDHRYCIEFPTHPWCHVITDGVCGFSFWPVSDADFAKLWKLESAWR